MFPVTLEISKRMTNYIDQYIKTSNTDGMDGKDVSEKRFKSNHGDFSLLLTFLACVTFYGRYYSRLCYGATK